MKQLVMEQLKQAMRDKDVLAKGVLTILKSGLDSAEKEKGTSLSETEQNAVVAREIKQTKQALEAAVNANRDDLIEKENAKIALLTSFLPKQITESEAKDLLIQAGVTSGLNMGEAMKIARPTLDGKIENSIVAKLVKELIA